MGESREKTRKAASKGDLFFFRLLAEGGGFEPPVRVYPARRFSKPLPSATQPSLQIVGEYYIKFAERRQRRPPKVSSCAD